MLFIVVCWKQNGVQSFKYMNFSLYKGIKTIAVQIVSLDSRRFANCFGRANARVHCRPNDIVVCLPTADALYVLTNKILFI